MAGGMTLYFIVKYLHVLGAIVILGTGTGIAFFMLMAHQSRDVAFIARTAATVVIADMLFTLTAVVLQPVTGGLLMALSGTTFAERWLVSSLGLYAVAGLFWIPVIFMQIEMRDLARKARGATAAAAAALFQAVSPLVFIRHSRFRFSHDHSLADDRQADLMGMVPKVGTGFRRRSCPIKECTHERARKILVLGASGLIGHFVTDDLRARGFHVVGIARPFSPSQKASPLDLELPVMSIDAASLATLIGEHDINLVVNCLGVLQDGPGSDTRAVHRDFVARLLQAIQDSGRAIRLVHISIPGAANEDRTAFSTTKREAERLIAASGIPYAILRPGFVTAPSAYGGSAMLRALAAFPIDLPAGIARRRSSRSRSRILRRRLPGSPATNGDARAPMP